MPEQTLWRLCGVLDGAENSPLAMKNVSRVTVDLPAEFDAREHWPECPTIQEIRDQSVCGSCWAFGAVEAMSDRTCIHSQGEIHVRLSSEDVLGCCSNCGSGCDGGFPGRAWEYWVREGIVSGGPYGSHQGCQPYLIAPCTDKPCPKPHTPVCQRQCQQDYSVAYEDDKHYGKTVYSIANDERLIRQEIYQNGPVEGAFDVYHDFYSYKSGRFYRF